MNWEAGAGEFFGATKQRLARVSQVLSTPDIGTVLSHRALNFNGLMRWINTSSGDSPARMKGLVLE